MESTKLRTFVFAGKNPPENPRVGDIWRSSGIGNPMMVWTENGAVEIGNVPSSLNCDFPPMIDRLEYPTHCPSCGAPVNSSRHKCEYCGVEYRKISYKNQQIIF